MASLFSAFSAALQAVQDHWQKDEETQETGQAWLEGPDIWEASTHSARKLGKRGEAWKDRGRNTREDVVTCV